jgi:hypothetical protein
VDYTEWICKWQEIWSANWGISAVVSGLFVCLLLARQPLQWVRASSFTGFLDHTQRHTTVGRTPLDERSARRRGLYLTTHTTLTKDRHPFPLWNSNPQSQQATGRTHTTNTARPLGTALVCLGENRKERATVAWAPRTHASRIQKDKVSELISVFLRHTSNYTSCNKAVFWGNLRPFPLHIGVMHIHNMNLLNWPCVLLYSHVAISESLTRLFIKFKIGQYHHDVLP